MAGLGSVERIVELHDRGTFGATPGDEGAAAAVAGDDTRRRIFRNAGPTFEEAAASASAAGTAAAAAAAGTDDVRVPLLQPAASGSGSGPSGRRSGSIAAAESGSAWLTHPASTSIFNWSAGPKPGRPDFGKMMGGVRLELVRLTVRNHTERLLLRDASMEVKAGQAIVITGELGDRDQAIVITGDRLGDRDHG